MAVHFLFPAHPLRTTLVDEVFADQFAAFRDAGYSVSLCPDAVIRDGKPLRNVPVGVTVVYRGWMFNASEYVRLTEAIEQASAAPWVDAQTYLAAHHLPRWYASVSDLTPETHVVPAEADLEAELRALGWDAFFIKDYVKSLKTSVGSIVRDPSQIGTVTAEMERVRGEIEGGFCIRRVEAFITETERRFFVLNGSAFAPDGCAAPDLVCEVARCVALPFYSVDIVKREDGAWRLIEIGDGQVSDLVGWSVDAFVAMWRKMLPPK